MFLSGLRSSGKRRRTDNEKGEEKKKKTQVEGMITLTSVKIRLGFLGTLSEKGNVQGSNGGCRERMEDNMRRKRGLRDSITEL